MTIDQVQTENAELRQQVRVLQEQQARTIDMARLILQGKWDEARIHLDAVSPGMAGKWANVPFGDR